MPAHGAYCESAVDEQDFAGGSSLLSNTKKSGLPPTPYKKPPSIHSDSGYSSKTGLTSAGSAASRSASGRVSRTAPRRSLDASGPLSADGHALSRSKTTNAAPGRSSAQPASTGPQSSAPPPRSVSAAPPQHQQHHETRYTLPLRDSSAAAAATVKKPRPQPPPSPASMPTYSPYFPPPSPQYYSYSYQHPQPHAMPPPSAWPQQPPPQQQQQPQFSQPQAQARPRRPSLSTTRRPASIAVPSSAAYDPFAQPSTPSSWGVSSPLGYGQTPPTPNSLTSPSPNGYGTPGPKPTENAIRVPFGWMVPTEEPAARPRPRKDSSSHANRRNSYVGVGLPPANVVVSDPRYQAEPRPDHELMPPPQMRRPSTTQPTGQHISMPFRPPPPPKASRPSAGQKARSASYFAPPEDPVREVPSSKHRKRSESNTPHANRGQKMDRNTRDAEQHMGARELEASKKSTQERTEEELQSRRLSYSSNDLSRTPSKSHRSRAQSQSTRSITESERDRREMRIAYEGATMSFSGDTDGKDINISFGDDGKPQRLTIASSSNGRSRHYLDEGSTRSKGSFASRAERMRTKKRDSVVDIAEVDNEQAMVRTDSSSS